MHSTGVNTAALAWCLNMNSCSKSSRSFPAWGYQTSLYTVRRQPLQVTGFISTLTSQKAPDDAMAQRCYVPCSIFRYGTTVMLPVHCTVLICLATTTWIHRMCISQGLSCSRPTSKVVFWKFLALSWMPHRQCLRHSSKATETLEAPGPCPEFQILWAEAVQLVRGGDDGS